jgi:hypothetical protein
LKDAASVAAVRGKEEAEIQQEMGR